MIISDQHGRISPSTARFTAATGYTAEEAVGQSPRILQSGLTPVEVYHDLWATILRGDVWRGELRNRTRDGELVWHSAAIAPLRDTDGTITHFVGVQADITPYKEAIETLDERDQRFRQLADNIREVFFVVASDYSETLYINPAFEKIWGRSIASLYDDPRSFMDAIEPEDRERVQAGMARNLRGETTGEVEFRIRRPDGEVRTVLAHSVPVLNDRGAVYRIIGVIMDVTERRRAEQAHLASESMFRNLIETSFNGIVITEDEVIIEVNAGLARIVGYRTNEIVGRPVLDFIAEESREEVKPSIFFAANFEGSYEIVGASARTASGSSSRRRPGCTGSTADSDVD